MTRNVIQCLCFSLFLLGCNEDQQSTSNEQQTNGDSPQIVFPLPQSLTSAESITVRGIVDSDVTNLKINNLDVDLTTYASQGFWSVSVPLQLGYNDLTATYTNQAGNQTGNTYQIRRNGYFAERPSLASYAQSAELLIVYDDETDSLLSLDTNTQQIAFIHQIKVEQSPDNAQDDDELHEQAPQSIAVTQDGSTIYYYTWFNSEFYVRTVDVASGIASTFYGPSSAGYSTPSFTQDYPMLLDETRNQLIFTNEGATQGASALNLSSLTISSLNVPNLSTLTSNGSDTYLHWSMKDDNTLIFMGQSVSDYFTAEVDIATGAFANYSGLVSLANNCEASSYSSVYSYQRTDQRYYWSSSDDTLCYFDTATPQLVNVSDDLEGFPNNDLISLRFIQAYQDYLIVLGGSDSTYQLVRYDSSHRMTLLGEGMEAGDSFINPTTAREVLLDDDNGKTYYVLRDNEVRTGSQIFELTTATSQWREIGTYPNVRFEAAILDSADNAIYAFNDDASINVDLYKIEIDTGRSHEVITNVEKAAIPFPDFDVETLAFNATNRIIYLARDVNEAVPSGYGTFGVVAWDIESQQLTDIVPISNQADATSLKSSYDMIYDPAAHQVVIYRSGGDQAIWKINLNTGLREILSDDVSYAGPTNSNARGFSFDANNQRIVTSSQNTQSLYEIDLNTGNKTLISPEKQGIGPVLISPKGVDVNTSKQIAVVADEAIDGIYYVDLVTGERVIIQN